MSERIINRVILHGGQQILERVFDRLGRFAVGLSGRTGVWRVTPLGSAAASFSRIQRGRAAGAVVTEPPPPQPAIASVQQAAIISKMGKCVSIRFAHHGEPSFSILPVPNTGIRTGSGSK